MEEKYNVNYEIVKTLDTAERRLNYVATGFIKSAFVNMVITAIWYIFEYRQFGELQWSRNCDDMVSFLYFIVLWFLFSKNEKEKERCRVLEKGKTKEDKDANKINA